jgi:uncharacterized protein (UPF0261 family)
VAGLAGKDAVTRAMIHAVATCDTKGEELAYLADRIRRAGGRVRTVDVGTRAPPTVPVDVSREQVLAALSGLPPEDAAGGSAVGGSALGDAARLIAGLDRGVAVARMAEALAAFLAAEHRAGRVTAVIGLGGSGGTAILAPAFRGLPLGVPKIVVSTLAGGPTGAYVDVSDLVMLPSVVDVAGLNAVSRRVLANAAGAVVGMTAHGAATVAPRDSRAAVALTMFGVTTPCVTAVRGPLEAEGFDCLVFHATGTGGRAMESLVAEGLVAGVLDLTTTEAADEVAGGIFPAGPDRFRTIARAGLPCVASVGAMDMVNFGPPESGPERYRGRLLHAHNPQITLMRTTPEENVRCARLLAERLAAAVGPLEILLPLRGVSALDREGAVFHDPEADAALFAEIGRLLPDTATRKVRRIDAHVNDPAFAREVLAAFARTRKAAGVP